MTIKINRRVRLALRTKRSAKKNADIKIRKYIEKVYEIIDTSGYFVQGVSNGEGSYLYTVGRLRKNLPELIVIGADVRTGGWLINHLIETDHPILKEGNFYREFQLDSIFCKRTNEATKMMAVYASPKDIEEKMLLSQKEYFYRFWSLSRTGKKVTGKDFPKPIKIMLADANNRLPPSHRGSAEAREQLVKDAARFNVVESKLMEIVEQVARRHKTTYLHEDPFWQNQK